MVEQLGDELLVFDSRTGEAHALTPLASSVFERCDGRTTFTGLAAELGLSEARLLEVLAQLGERGLLADDGLSRREAMRKAAVLSAGAAAGVPLIKSILVPTAARAQSVCQATQLLGEECVDACECVNPDACCCYGSITGFPACFSPSNCALAGGTCA